MVLKMRKKIEYKLLTTPQQSIAETENLCDIPWKIREIGVKAAERYTKKAERAMQQPRKSSTD
jgi:hypothetical protein